MRVITKAPAKITRATIEAAWRQRASDQRLIVRDTECRGLAFIVNPTTMTWTFSYRPRGVDPRTGKRPPNRTITIGNPETHSPEAARAAANKIKGATVAGADPAAERRAHLEEERRKRAMTLVVLAEDYASALPNRRKLRGTGRRSPSYVIEEMAQLRMALATMKTEHMPVVELAEANVRKLLNAEGDVARKRFGALSRFLDWCQDEKHIATNPCALIARSRRPKAPQARAYYLTLPELGRLWRACDDLREPVWRDFARFLIAIPCRRGEAARMEWSHLDLAAAEWRQPAHLTKNRDPHRLHMYPLALGLLRERHTAADAPTSGLVFPAPVSGKPIDTFTKLKAALAEATKPALRLGSGDDGWTWHDFRRSFATVLGEAGIPEAVADAVLNHRQSATRGGVLGVYQRASRWPEQVRAMELWGRLLTAAIEGREAGADVVSLHPKQSTGAA